MAYATQPITLPGIPGEMLAGGLVLNCEDQAIGTQCPDSQSTPGSTLIVPIVPILSQTAPIPQKLLGVTINAQHLWTSLGGTFGKWGKILGGIVFAQTANVVSTGNAFGPGINNITDFPADSSLITTLWDEDNDPLPPQPSGAVPILSNPPQIISGSVQLQSPYSFSEGRPVSVAIWMMPSLIGGYPQTGVAAEWQWNRQLIQAQASVQYDVG